jgi:glycosyltransferase involved in cell wall biosynthesis
VITVVHLITKLEMGGAQENTLDTCERLDRSRFRVALIFGPGGALDKRAMAMRDTEIEVMPELVRNIDPRKDLRGLLSLSSRVRIAFDEHRRLGFPRDAFIVHTHSSKAGVLGRLAARVARVPLIVHTIHGFGFFEGQAPAAKAAFIGAERAAARVTDAFISVSRANLAEAQSRQIIDRSHVVRVIRSGFELAELRAAGERRDEARKRLEVPEDAELIVSIANFKPQKDPLTMIEAFALLVRRRPNAMLLYAGDGELRPEVERMIARYELGSRVRLLGWRDDVPQLLAASDVVALSSIFEGLPRTAVQALVVRRPFVGTRVDGTPEVIRDGKNGFLVPPRDARAFAEALDRALAERPVDPEDLERVKAWDVNVMVREQEALYEELVQKKG